MKKITPVTEKVADLVPVAPAAKAFSSADYERNNNIVLFVTESDVMTKVALKLFRKNGLGSSKYAKEKLADLGRKLSLNGNLSDGQILFAQGLLAQHRNILVAMFSEKYSQYCLAEEAKAKRAEAANAVDAGIIPADANPLNESPDDSDVPF